MRELWKRLSQLISRKQTKFVSVSDVEFESYNLTYEDLRRYFRTSYTLASIYNLFASAAGRISVVVYENDVEHVFLSQNFTKNLQDIFAHYMLFGIVYLNESLDVLEKDENWDFFAYNKYCVSYSAIKLFQKLIHLERAEKQLAERLGATVLITPSDPSRPMLEEDFEFFRELVREKLQRGGVGGIEPTKFDINFKEIPVDYEKYALDSNWERTIRSLCGLYAIDSSLLGDPRNKTYSNKELALLSFYTDNIIPNVKKTISSVLDSLQVYKFQKTSDVYKYNFEIKTESIEILSYWKEKNVDFVIKLLEKGIITLEEARDMIHA